MLADVNDVDLVSLLEGSLVGSASTGWESDSLTAGNMVDAPACEIASSETGHAAETADRAFDSLLLFCNNVAFNEGTIRRCWLLFAPRKYSRGPHSPLPFSASCRFVSEPRL